MSSRSPRGSGVDLTTLVITAVASAVAAYVTSKVWAPGTLASAAATPVIIALLKEALSRPAEAVTRVVPVRGVVRSAPPPGGEAEAEPPPAPALERVPQQGEVSYHATGGFSRRWRLALVTGVLGFVVAVAALTIPELIAGGSASGGGRSTTLFGGGSDRSGTRTTTVQTTTVQSRTVTVQTKTVTVPAPETKTAPAPVTTAPTPTTPATTTTSTTTVPAP